MEDKQPTDVEVAGLLKNGVPENALLITRVDKNHFCVQSGDRWNQHLTWDEALATAASWVADGRKHGFLMNQDEHRKMEAMIRGACNAD